MQSDGAYDRNRTLLVCPFFRGLDSECIYGLPTKRVYEDSTHFLALESYLRSHFFLRLPLPVVSLLRRYTF